MGKRKYEHRGDVIRDFIDTIQMPYQEFAAQIGISKQNLSGILHGKRISFTADRLELFYNAGLDPGYVLSLGEYGEMFAQNEVGRAKKMKYARPALIDMQSGYLRRFRIWVEVNYGELELFYAAAPQINPDHLSYYFFRTGGQADTKTKVLLESAGMNLDWLYGDDTQSMWAENSQGKALRKRVCKDCDDVVSSETDFEKRISQMIERKLKEKTK